MKETNEQKRMEVVESTINPSTIIMSDTTKSKYHKGIWKAKGEDGKPAELEIAKMSVDHKLRALAVAERQAGKHHFITELYCAKYQEFVESLALDGISEEEAKKMIAELPNRKVEA